MSMEEKVVHVVMKNVTRGNDGLSGSVMIGIYDDVEMAKSTVVSHMNSIYENHTGCHIQEIEEGYFITISPTYVVSLYSYPMVLNVDYTLLN